MRNNVIITYGFRKKAISILTFITRRGIKRHAMIKSRSFNSQIIMHNTTKNLKKYYSLFLHLIIVYE